MKLKGEISDVTRHNDASGNSRIPQSKSKVEGWLLAACIYFVVVQPLVLFVFPVLTYHQDRLPGTESAFMLATSVGAWRDLFMTVFGIIVGARMWQGRPGAVAEIRFYLVMYLFSAAILVALLVVIPFHSYLRTAVRIEQAKDFAYALLSFTVCYAYFHYSTRAREACVVAQAGLARTGFGHGREVVSRPAFATGIGLVGTCFSLASFLTAPADIFEAAWEGNIKAVRQFVANRVDVNSTTPDVSIPLHFAKSGDVAEFLIATSSERESSYLLSDDDFRNLPGLIERLRVRRDPVSQWIWTRLSGGTREVLSDDRCPAVLISEPLRNDLNKILLSDLSSASRAFAQVPLSRAIQALQAQKPQGAQAIHLSRLLLQAAYPHEIAKYHVDWRNMKKETPLHMAAYNGRPGVALVLADNGADCAATNWAGLTPLDYALYGKSKRRKGDFDAVIALLAERGGKANMFPVNANCAASARDVRWLAAKSKKYPTGCASGKGS